MSRYLIPLPLLLFACFDFLGTSGQPRPLDVQGHRGARGLAPENTLEGFRRALELGVSTLELDLGVTRDRRVVVSHDPEINPAVCRHADGSKLGEPQLLRSLDLQKVRSFDCGSLNPDRRRFPEPPRRNIPGAQIPTLQEVFELSAHAGDDEVRFNIEIKVDPTVDNTVPLEEFVGLVVDVVRRNKVRERVTLQSFDWRALEHSKRLEPGLETAALLAPGTLDPVWLAGLDPPELGGTVLGLLTAAAATVDIFSPAWEMLMPESPTYGGNTVAEIQAAGLSVIPWTVNRRQDMETVLDLGVDGIITDYPDVLIALLKEQDHPIR